MTAVSDKLLAGNAQWKHFLQVYQAYTVAKRDLLLNDAEQITEVIGKASILPEQRAAALDVAKSLSPEQLQMIISNLLAIASSLNGQMDTARDLILTIPRTWLLEHIEDAAESVLMREDDEDYRGLFELYLRIERQLARRLAERAVASQKPEVVEAGKYFMEVLNRGT
jgi:hypothetical protein